MGVIDSGLVTGNFAHNERTFCDIGSFNWYDEHAFLQRKGTNDKDNEETFLEVTSLYGTLSLKNCLVPGKLWTRISN